MDILFKNDDFVFSYRVGGILTHNGNISKSVIKEDIDELQDKIQSTIQKINAAQEAGKK